MTSYVLLKSVILILVIHINIIPPTTSRSYKWFFPSGCRTEPLYTFIFSPTCATHPAISPPLYHKTRPSINYPFLRLGILPKRQTYFKRAMTQGFTTVQTNRRTDILYGSTYTPDGGNWPETSVPIRQSTRRRMPEDNNHRINFIEFQDFWDVTLRYWATIDVSK
jgi:hypothetical protein